MRFIRMFAGLAAVVLASGSLVLTGGPTGVLTAHAADALVPQTGLPIPVPPPPNAPHATRSYTPTYYGNWSGYAQKVSTATGPYTAVRDYWTVPRVDTSLSGEQYSSDWVGIDEGNSSGGDLVQDGTEADNISGTAQYNAWTEILPAKEVKISSLKIHPGDQIEGLVEETSKNVWKMTIHDLATGQSGGRTVTYNASNGGPAAQTAVEVIHERPCLAIPCSDPSNLATLAQTTSVTFNPGFYSTAAYTPKWKPLLAAVPGATVDQIFMQNKAGTTIASPSVPSANKEGFTVADGAAAPSAPWGTAEEVPGLAALNTGGAARVLSVSCGAAGECSAGGYYTVLNSPYTNYQEGFVVSETGGVWGAAEEVPTNPGFSQSMGVSSVSCAVAGYCTAGGYYWTPGAGGGKQGFMVNETGGVWGLAQNVPFLANLNTGGDAAVLSVSCRAVGDCAAGGYYFDFGVGADELQGFVVSETGGSWNGAEPISGLVPVNGSNAEVLSVSCGAAGDCSAGGYTSSTQQGYVVNETGGVWGTAQEVTSESGQVSSVSCATARNCSAGGWSSVVNETGTVWGFAQEISGPPGLDTTANVLSVSCAAAGDCSAGGWYTDSSGDQQGFVVSETSTG